MNSTLRTPQAGQNKGFSLVEIIITIAIIAVLLAILAPLLIRYVERSRISVDAAAVGEMYRVLKTAASDPQLTNLPDFPPFLVLVWNCPNGGTVTVNGNTAGDPYYDAVDPTLAFPVLAKSRTIAGALVTITINTTDGESTVVAAPLTGSRANQDYLTELLDNIK